MFDERTTKIAEEFGLMEKLKRFHADLLAIDGMTRVEYDLSGFWSNINEVIFLPFYNLAAENFFVRRKALLKEIIAAAERNELAFTGDRIEDYGPCFYCVTSCNWATK